MLHCFRLIAHLLVHLTESLMTHWMSALCSPLICEDCLLWLHFIHSNSLSVAITCVQTGASILECGLFPCLGEPTSGSDWILSTSRVTIQMIDTHFDHGSAVSVLSCLIHPVIPLLNILLEKSQLVHCWRVIPFGGFHKQLLLLRLVLCEFSQCEKSQRIVMLICRFPQPFHCLVLVLRHSLSVQIAPSQNIHSLRIIGLRSHFEQFHTLFFLVLDIF
mmetsp:Transcript_6492/g.24396  ORF Transcript_6492/g.24396 Transcript_6492/m.24396 type:complete len:218 (-) Transcript_6492:268-921(-)